MNQTDMQSIFIYLDGIPKSGIKTYPFIRYHNIYGNGW